MKVKDHKIKTKDNDELYLKTYQRSDSDRLIIINHGFGEHSGRYRHIIEFLYEKGFNIAAFDMRGHGLSQGKIGYVDSFLELVEDLDMIIDFAKQEISPNKTVLYGHSTGGTVALNYATSGNGKFDLLVGTSPWIELNNKEIHYRLAKNFQKLIPKFSFSTRIKAHNLMLDKDFQKLYKEDKLINQTMSLKYFVECYEWGRSLLEKSGSIDKKTLLMHGESDKITSHKATKKFSEKNQDMISFKSWPGLKHEIHNEEKWKEILEYASNWIESNLYN